MYSCVLLLTLLLLQSDQGSGSPINRRNLLQSSRENDPNYRESRQAGIISGWIQGSQLFPIEINVPDIISNASNGLQSFGQGIGQGVQSFGQNLNQNYQTWISNLGQRFPIINRLPFLGNHNNLNSKPPTQKYLILVPMESVDNKLEKNSIMVKPNFSDLPESAELFTYP